LFSPIVALWSPLFKSPKRSRGKTYQFHCATDLARIRSTCLNKAGDPSRRQSGTADHPVVKKTVNSNSASFMLCAKPLGGNAGVKAVTF
jgi:hypothetical protein